MTYQLPYKTNNIYSVKIMTVAGAGMRGKLTNTDN